MKTFMFYITLYKDRFLKSFQLIEKKSFKLGDFSPDIEKSLRVATVHHCI